MSVRVCAIAARAGVARAGVARAVLAGVTLLLGSAGVSAAAAQEVPSASGVRSLAVVLAGRLNLRATPSLDAPVALTVERGDTLCVLEASDDWLEVIVPEEDGAASSPVWAARGFVSRLRANAEAVRRAGCG